MSLEDECKDALRELHKEALLVDFVVLPREGESVANLHKTAFPSGVALVMNPLAILYCIAQDTLGMWR